MKPRPIYMSIWLDLSAEKPMVFMAGPRQTGKTTLAQMISEEYINRLYFNWDNPQHRTPPDRKSIFFQEIERRIP